MLRVFKLQRPYFLLKKVKKPQKKTIFCGITGISGCVLSLLFVNSDVSSHNSLPSISLKKKLSSKSEDQTLNSHHWH